MLYGTVCGPPRGHYSCLLLLCENVETSVLRSSNFSREAKILNFCEIVLILNVSN